MEENTSFQNSFLLEFRNWLNLNYDALTWQGRYEDEFEEFWAEFFVEGKTLPQMAERFRYTLLYAQIGPLSSWFTWIRNSFLSYIFIKLDISLIQLSQLSGISFDALGIILREFFLEHYPEYEDELSDRFQVANRMSPNLNLKYSDLKKELDLDSDAEERNPENVLSSMEVTLYPEWKILNARMKKDFSNKNFDFSRIKNNLSFSRQVKVFRDILIFLIVGVGLVYGLRMMNENWEKSILEQISIYEPQLKWLDTTLSFKDEDKTSRKDFELSEKQLEEVESKESEFDSLGFQDDVRYEEESDVVLTSWDALPKDFDTVNLEQSDYEELKNGGYRDSRYGNTKVYRVLMRSVDTANSKVMLNSIIKKYEATRVDNVKPGKSVPGGIYYNLYVPRKYLKEFMAQVMEIDEAVLYESRTRTGRNPPGQNKVFIWVKNI